MNATHTKARCSAISSNGDAESSPRFIRIPGRGRPSPITQLVRAAYVGFACLFAFVLAPFAIGQDALAAKKIGVGLYGSNGHQVRPDKLATHPHARLVAVAGVRASTLPAGVKRYATLDELIPDPAG